MALQTSNVIYSLPLVTTVPETPAAGRAIGPIPRLDGYFMKDSTGALRKIGPPTFFRQSINVNVTTNTLATWQTAYTWTGGIDDTHKKGDWLLQGSFQFIHGSDDGMGYMRVKFTGAHSITTRSLPWHTCKSPNHGRSKELNLMNWVQTFTTEGAGDVVFEYQNMTTGVATFRVIQFLMYQLSVVE